MAAGRNGSAFAGKGFTLVELLMVIAVIGILSAIAIPYLIILKDKSVFGVAQQNLSVMRSALAAYAARSEDNKFPVGDILYEDFLPTGILAEANMPSQMADAKLVYLNYVSSEGVGYSLVGVAATRHNDAITATPRGISPSSYPH